MPINFPTTGLVPNVTTYSYAGKSWKWNGSVWESIGSVQGIAGAQGFIGIQGFIGNYINVSSSTPPSSPSQGTTWYDSSTAKQFVYYGTAWVELGNSQIPIGAQGLQGTTGTSGILSSTSSYLSGNVSMINANTFYNGPSLTLNAGTYYITGVSNIQSATNTTMKVTTKLYNGSTTAYGSSETLTLAAGAGIVGISNSSIHALVTLASTTTIFLGSASTAASSIMLATVPDNNTNLTNLSTGIIALRIG